MRSGPALALRPEPSQARGWLTHELTRAEYHQQSWQQHILFWLERLWHSMTNGASHATGLSLVAAITVLVALVSVALAVLPRLTRTPSTPDERTPLGASRKSAAEHRARAEAALQEGDTHTAVIEATRALARRMVDRGVLEDTPGSTAHEIAVTLAVAFPDVADQLTAAAETFDAVQYGDGVATTGESAQILWLDEELRHISPTMQTGPTLTPAVPR